MKQKIQIKQYLLIKQDYLNNLSACKLAVKYNCGTTTIYRILNKLKVERRKPDKFLKKKYKLNENYFSKINTPEKAYMLGFIYADGHNQSSPRRNRFIINLAIQDIDILKKLKKCLNSNAPIKITKKTKNRQDVCTFAIYNKKISSDLLKHGVAKNKTYTLKFPKHLSEKLYSHFIRGYFDGDGSIKKRGKNGANFDIVGRKKLINKIKNILISKLKLPDKKLRKDKSIHVVHLVYGKKDECLKIKNYLYKNADIYMNRKFTEFSKII